MTPGAHRARAADYSHGALRLLIAAHQEAEAGGLDVDIGELMAGAAQFADELLTAADDYAARAGCAVEIPERRATA